MTRFQLTWGAAGVVDPQCRHFPAVEGNDAVTRFAEKVVELDRNPAVSAGWVRLEQLPAEAVPGRFIVAWTKTSDERSTSEGADAAPEAV